jgi:hypothetical protein
MVPGRHVTHVVAAEKDDTDPAGQSGQEEAPGRSEAEPGAQGEQEEEPLEAEKVPSRQSEHSPPAVEE